MYAGGWLGTLVTNAVAFAVSSILAALFTLGAGLAPRLGRALLARSVEIGGTIPTILVLGGTTHRSSLPTFLLLGLAVGFALGVRLGRALYLELASSLGTDELASARALGLGPARAARDHLWPHVKGHVYLNAALTPAVVVSAEAALALLGTSDGGAPSLGGLLVLPGASRYLALALLTALSVFLIWGALSKMGQIRREMTPPKRPS